MLKDVWLHLQVVANWADAVLAMIELLPASGKLAQGKLRFLGRKFRPETVVGMVSPSLSKPHYSLQPSIQC